MSAFQFNGIPPATFSHADQNVRDWNRQQAEAKFEEDMNMLAYTWQPIWEPPLPEGLVKCVTCGRKIPPLRENCSEGRFVCGKFGHYNPRNPNDQEFTTQ